MAWSRYRARRSSYPTAKPKTDSAKKLPFDQWSFTGTYDYLDAEGRLIYQVCRYAPKTFRQRRPTVPHPDNNNRQHWEWKLTDTPLVPYRLPELLAADTSQPVFVVEGEKDADRLREMGLVATTNAMGAGKWKPHYRDSLLGRKVVVLADNDEPGRRHAQMVAASLKGYAASVAYTDLPNVPPGGDVSDWLDAGNTVEQLLDRGKEVLSSGGGRAELHVVQPPSAPTSYKDRVRTITELMGDDLPVLRQVIPGLLTEGLTVVGGASKMGKNIMTGNLAVAVATGGQALGRYSVQQGDVLLLALEDGERRLQRRMKQWLETATQGGVSSMPPPGDGLMREGSNSSRTG
jgi:hypothetical protein